MKKMNMEARDPSAKGYYYAMGRLKADKNNMEKRKEFIRLKNAYEEIMKKNAA